jgi:hypothetical protein
VAPWQLERAYYADASVAEILHAAKILGAPENDASALDTAAYRLLTPISLWSRLHFELRTAAATTMMTLGGHDERGMWQQWHRSFGGPVSHLYNPPMERTTHDAAILRFGSPEEFRDVLVQALSKTNWDAEGGYVHWIGRNAFLLPQFIVDSEPLVVSGHRLQTWPDVKTALGSRDGLDAVSRYVSRFFLGSSTVERR